MKILLDNNMPNLLKKVLPKHVVMPARKFGWARLSNGDLIRAAEFERFDLLITGDKDMEYQQNNEKRRIALIILSSMLRPEIDAAHERIVKAVEVAAPGTPGTFAYVELTKPQ